MRKAGGYVTISQPRTGMVNFDGLRCEEVKEGIFEVDTFTCIHCGAVEHVEAKADVNRVGFCRNCMKPICQRCSDQPCVPFEKKLEMIERKVDWRRQFDENLRGMW